MLPGFRFLFAAILLAMSILIFGLGAAALLRAAHEEFASNPAWRAPSETVFAQQSEPAKPVLAALVIEPPEGEQKEPEIPLAAVPEATAAVAAPAAEPEQAVAPKPEQAAPREAARSEPLAETPPAREPAPIQANTTPETPAPATETKMAAIEQTLPPAGEAAPAGPEQASAPAAPNVDTAATKIATLGGPPAVETPPLAKAETAAPDKSAIKRRLRARRARERRRLAALRARLAQQAALQPVINPFAQLANATAATTANNPPHIR